MSFKFCLNINYLNILSLYYMTTRPLSLGISIVFSVVLFSFSTHDTIQHYLTLFDTDKNNLICHMESLYMHFLVFKNISITKKACLASCACQGAKLAIFKFFSKFKKNEKKFFFHFFFKISKKNFFSFFFSKLHLPNYLV